MSLFERAYQWGEYQLARSFPRTRVRGLWRFFFRLPITAYKLGLGWMLGRSVLVVETTGRVSGQRRYAAIGYGYDEAAGIYVVNDGWQGRTDWYRNLKKDPHCSVRVGRKRFDCTAHFLTVEEGVAHMQKMMPRNPYATRVWSEILGEELDMSAESLRKVVARYPLVGFKPTS